MKSPAFRFYPGDFMGSPDVQTMDLHEVGAYVLLLCVAWQQDRHGCLPDNDERLRRWSKMTRDQWTDSRDLILGKFPIVEPGLRANPRMVIEAAKQKDLSLSQQTKARKRWSKTDEVPRQCQTDAETMPGHVVSDAGGIPSVSVSVFASASASVFDSESVPVSREHKLSRSLLPAVTTISKSAAYAQDDPEWPADLERDVAVSQLLACHPRPTSGHQSEATVVEEIFKLAKARGKGEWEAYTYLRARFEAYRLATDRWPEDEHQYIQTSLQFLVKGAYAHKESMWRRGDDGSNGDSVGSAILRQLAKEEGFDAKDRAPAGRCTPEELSRLRKEARERAYGSKQRPT